jgi:hypothetical protein
VGRGRPRPHAFFFASLAVGLGDLCGEGFWKIRENPWPDFPLCNSLPSVVESSYRFRETSNTKLNNCTSVIPMVTYTAISSRRDASFALRIWPAISLVVW